MLTLLDNIRCFNGQQLRYQHASDILGCDMVFSVYIPDHAIGIKLPHLYWLSGLTCNDQNFVTKAGAQRYASEAGMILIAPDTSPRGDGITDDEHWDLGQGAGFYLNANQSPWDKHYKMYDYIVQELIPLIDAAQPVDPQRRAISGHSMGGHGAITIALKHPDQFKSISAFAPICAPMKCPWGEKAFSQYLGDDRSTWNSYDSSELIRARGLPLPLLIDQGLEDSFLQEQLKPETLEAACQAQQCSDQLTLRRHPGFDHSYYFIASFIGEHIAFHSKHL